MHSCNDDSTNQGISAWLTEEDASRRHPRGDGWREIGGRTCGETAVLATLVICSKIIQSLLATGKILSNEQP